MANVYGGSLSAIGQLPVCGGVSLQARAGLNRWTLEQTVSGTVTAINGTDKESGTSPVFGLGVAWDIKRMRLSATFEQMNDVGNPDTTGEEDVRVFTLGIAHRFR